MRLLTVLLLAACAPVGVAPDREPTSVDDLDKPEPYETFEDVGFPLSVSNFSVDDPLGDGIWQVTDTLHLEVLVTELDGEEFLTPMVEFTSDHWNIGLALSVVSGADIDANEATVVAIELNAHDVEDGEVVTITAMPTWLEHLSSGEKAPEEFGTSITLVMGEELPH